MAEQEWVSGIGGVARVMYLGETKALEVPWPAPRTGAEELAAGAGRRRSSMGSATLDVAPCRERSCGGRGRPIKTGPFLTSSAWPPLLGPTVRP